MENIGRPRNGKILIKPPEEKEASKEKGVLYIPEESRLTPNRGVVISFGKDITDLKVGETVLYGKTSGTPLEVNNVYYVLLREDDILLVK